MRHVGGFVLWLGVILGGAPSAMAANCVPVKPILQAVESVVLLGEQEQARVQARVDTGATLSSIDSALAQRLGLDQKPLREIWVRNAHGVTRRLVVRIKFVLKGQVREGEFSLIPREQMAHPVLLGRQSIKGFWVDPGE